LHGAVKRVFWSKYLGIEIYCRTYQTTHTYQNSFKFTKVDPADESRHFSFTVYLDEDNDYQLSNCNPSLGKTKTRPLVDQLNLDGKEGFNSFTIGIRKLFKETV